MDVSQSDLRKRISLLWTKIRTILEMANLEDELSVKSFSALQKSVEEYLTEVDICVSKIQLQSSEEEDWIQIEKESLAHTLRFRRELERLELKLPPMAMDSLSLSPRSPEVGRAGASFTVKPPQIQIMGPTFDGLDMQSNPMSFKDFLSRFENCVAGMANDAERLNFLKCSLSGQPLLLINHLSISNRNYKVALSVLKSEYLDEDEIIDNIFQDILDFSCKQDRSVTALANYISKVASLLAELEGSFDCSFSNDLSSGARLMAKILFAKFPKEVKGELILISGRRIPTLSSILRDTKEAVKRLLIKGDKIPGSACNTMRGALGNVSSGPRSGTSRRDSSLQSNSAYSIHSGKFSSLPPVLCVTFGKGDKSVSVNCLLDTGSGRTYLSSKILDPLGHLESIGNDCEIRLTTILGDCDRRFKEVALEASIGSCCPFFLTVLVHENIDISVHIENLDFILDEFEHLKCPLAARFDRGTNFIPIHGIIGLDVIQHLGSLQLVPCLRGQAFLTPIGLVPFGEVKQFLHTEHSVDKNSECPTFDAVLASTAEVNPSHLCFVLESQGTYEDPLSDFFPESDVQRGLEKMFSVESLGIEEQELSHYDERKIALFRQSISFKDNKYYIQLPWEDDKISCVPSNHAVALRILERVVQGLEKRQLYQEYLQVFHQQERDGIIEEIFVPPQRFGEFVWIPHRPVLKSDPTSTTKIRPVFNCSLKIGDSPSLNEATYQGVNLTSDLLDLLLTFRANKHVVLADIKKAFLMIRLKLESDKNKFCFFLKEGGRLRCFRYNTIIFGYASSPFILNYVIKYHAAQFPMDNCRFMMENRFYVDNLVMSHDNSDELCRLYTLTRERLRQGGFELQSCNSNHVAIQSKMQEHGSLSDHGNKWEKVLGYRYCPLSDTLHVAAVECDSSAFTKRRILSETARVYDPLSLCLPVSLRGRILLSELWKKGLGWDTTVSPEYLSVWRKLSLDLSELGTVSFPRRALSENETGKLFLFCDASPEAYGFAAYVVQKCQSRLVFAKARVAPLKKKTLPTLELMAVFLALRCLPTLLRNFGGFSPSEIHVATDSQVVLSWLISGTIVSRNLFARNRLKDIQQMSAELEATLGFSPAFRYVPTTENPADLITRGLTLKRFKACLQFWCSGPDWLSSGSSPWAAQQLPCLNQHSQVVARSSWNAAILQGEESSTVLPLERFSSFTKLLRVTSLVLRFIHRLRRLEVDTERLAAILLMKTMQRQTYAEELAFLLDSSGRTVPGLVRDLDLFVDVDGLIRSGGRIARSLHFDTEIKHPVLLAKYHPVTRLIIMDAHTRCQHLGIASTLAELRRRGYWVPKGRQAVKTVLASCALCRKYNARQVLPPNVASLPASRVELEVPFKHTGVDFTGHLWVKEGAKVVKMYLLIFTCLSIRAVHVEVVPDMSVLAFLQALVRFTNLHGVPTAIYCDNAKTFIGGGRLFKRLMLSHDYQQKFGSCLIKFCPIPLFSPWVGGVWERSIQTIKNCLHKVVGRGEIDYFALLTIVSDIQRAINNRPLTYRESAETELEAVTPNMFLRPNKSHGLLLSLNDEDFSSHLPPSREKLLRTMQVRNQCLEKFRALWYDEYLLSLREKPLGRSRVPFRNRLKVGDVVLVKSPLKPRPFWVLGIILEMFYGEDGVVRSARVRQGGNAAHIHSLKNLFPLELSVDSESQVQSIPATVDGAGSLQSTPSQGEEVIWLCRVCSSPQGDQDMICCDGCDDWCHFRCVGIVSPPPERQKWYCTDCAPKRRRRGRPSLLPE